jgi:hypothetical protein
MIKLRVRWAWYVASMKPYTTLVGKPEGKLPRGKTRRMWRDNIKMNPKVRGCEDVKYVHMGQNKDQWRAPVNTLINILVA